MGLPESGLEAAGLPTADTLLTAFRTIKAPERARHVSVLDYWLSIRGDKEFPPLHDLDPLEISDAGPSSILLELIGGGQDAEIRHCGDALAGDATVQRIIDAPNPSILGCIAKKLPIVAISRDFLAFEDSFNAAQGLTRCWVTLLPLSSCGSWVDYVYAFVSVETSGAAAAKTAPEAKAVEPDVHPEEQSAEGFIEESLVADPEPVEPVLATDETHGSEHNSKQSPGFSRLIEGVANLAGFYGQGIKADDVVKVDLGTEESPVNDPAAHEPVVQQPIAEAAPEELVLDDVVEETSVEETAEVIEQPAVQETAEAIDRPIVEEAGEVTEEPTVEERPEAQRPLVEPEADLASEPTTPIPAPVMEGSLQSKLAEVQAKADEAREAQLRATQALHQGLSAAYDFALDAESCPEEYLRLVEAQGLKIQLRAPMAPVAKLAFNDICDAATIRQFEAVLAWALKVELPRGALLERIEQAGGIPELLNEFARAA